jgi:hypothetical protein
VATGTPFPDTPFRIGAAEALGAPALAMGATFIAFGAAAQNDLRAICQEMLSGVKAKDLGPAGQSLAEIVSTIRGFLGQNLSPIAAARGGSG